MSTPLPSVELDTACVELVLLRVGAARLALPLSAVSEVGRPPSLTRVPGLPGWVPGVANWRGRVLAVLDLGPLLGSGPQLLSARRSRLVVVTRDDVRVGLQVTAVEGTVEIAPDDVEAVPAHLPAEAAGLLGGAVTAADGPFGLLDVVAVLALADRLPRPRRS